MSYASTVLWNEVRRLLLGQSKIILLGGGGVWLNYDRFHAFAIFYGGSIAIIVTLLLCWQLQKLSLFYKQSKIRYMAHVSLGVGWRLLVIALGVWTGIRWLHLQPAWLVVGFSSAQLAYFLYLYEHRILTLRVRASITPC